MLLIFLCVFYSGANTAPGRDVGEFYQGSVGIWISSLPESIGTYKK